MGGGEGHAREEVAEILKRNRYRGLLLSANTATRAKNVATAERHFKSAVSEHPDSLGAASAYASWLADRDRSAEAFALIDTYQRRHPSDPQSLYQVGRLAAATGQQLDRGEEALRRSLAAPPPRAAYEQALTLDPRSNQARRALAGLK